VPYLSPALNVMVAAARKAARGLIRDFGELENLQVSRKGPADFVSTADNRTERILLEELTKARPGYAFLMEEGGTIEGTDKTHRFIIDPLDGTTNFLHGIPQFAISIALEREGQLQSAVVFNPVANELFTAERGHGAYLNDRRLRVAARERLPDCVIATGTPFHGTPGHEEFSAELSRVMSEVAGIRRFGSAALDLAWVAAGRFDAYWERDISAWDVAAGILLVREAGGVVSDLDNRQRMLDAGHILAANEHLHKQILALVRGSPRP
jgi:myo-inositol-1(or 4)-monophosphatase